MATNFADTVGNFGTTGASAIRNVNVISDDKEESIHRMCGLRANDANIVVKKLGGRDYS